MKLSDAQSLFKKNTMSVQSDPKTISDLKPAGRLTLEEAFEVYHNGYVIKLTETLAKTFESVAWVLGHDLFNDLCARYIESQPSVSYNLNEYGMTFPEYLVSTAKTKGIPFLEDLAHFEWLYKEIYHATTPDPLPAERAQELLHAEDFKVSFIEAMEIFQSHYAIHEIWRRRKEPPYMFEDINWGQPESLLIFKKDQKVLVNVLDPIEAEILTELQEGKSISEALADFASLMTPQKTTKLFQMMMKAGIIDDINLL